MIEVLSTQNNIRHLDKFTEETDALKFAIDGIMDNKIQEVAIHTPTYNSTDLSTLLYWYGENSYWHNRMKSSGQIVESIAIENRKIIGID